MINVLIAEERADTRNELRQVIEHIAEELGDECVISQTEDGIATFRKAKRVQPDMVLISSSLPHSGGVQVIFALRHYSPNARLVVIADREESAMRLLPYVAAGAHGVMLRQQSTESFEFALCRVLRGGSYYGGGVG